MHSFLGLVLLLQSACSTIIIGSTGPPTGLKFLSNEISNGEINSRLFTMPEDYMPPVETNQEVTFILFDGAKASGMVRYNYYQ